MTLALLLAAALAANAPAVSVSGAAKGVVDPEVRAQPVPAANPTPAPAAPVPGVAEEPNAVVRDLVAGGTHWRVPTDRGPIHLWKPAGYDAKTAGVLIYLHGYYTNVDEAWRMHKLGEQFRASRRNALFVVPEVPTGINDPVRWASPEILFETVQKQAGIEVPAGPVSAMGHSGAFRTLLAWLNSPRLEQIILLDGLYNAEDMFLAWLKTETAPPASHRMVIVGFETMERSLNFLTNLPEALYRENIPDAGARFQRREKLAKLLYIHSQFDHMGIVTDGRAIPVLLRLTRFRAL
ncbi:MAG TPA: hypothetical protein VGK67_39645 [Myxococcales bacterium]|jgi:hypothetical protein